MEVQLQARNDRVAKAIEDCARKHITFDECCEQVAAMGFKTTSVYEMVRLAEQEIDAQEQGKSNGLVCATTAMDYSDIFKG